MRHLLRVAIALTAPLAASACYHATVVTGAEPSGVTIEKPFAASFFDGLVPPDEVESASRCPNGISKIETQVSFLNLLVNSFTLGLYTPMEIKVSCAARPAANRASDALRELPLSSAVSLDSARRVFDAAAALALQSGQPTYVVRQ